MSAEFSLESGVQLTVYLPSSTVVTVLPQGTPISGTDGTDGTDGNTVLPVSGPPSNGVGVNGNFAIDYLNWKIYGPKAAGAWPAGVSLIGPAGSSAGASYSRIFQHMGG